MTYDAATNKTPEEIRADIERTRSELGSDVDALADKVSPHSIAERQKDKVKSAVGNAVGSVKDKVMGTVHDSSDAVHHAGSSLKGGAADALDNVKGTAGAAKGQAQGNPFAVGLIAFGAGLLAASLIPASEKEKEAASKVKEAAQPALHKATEVAKDAVSELKEPAQDAFASVKETATDAAGSVKEAGTSAASDVQDSAQKAKHAVQEDVKK